jgi:hypothetical protein
MYENAIENINELQKDAESLAKIHEENLNQINQQKDNQHMKYERALNNKIEQIMKEKLILQNENALLRKWKN